MALARPARRWAAPVGMLLWLVCGMMPARAAPTSPWVALADPVFRPVSLIQDVPNLVMPWTMAEDARGMLWGGGADGLVRWDGYRYRLYSADQHPADGLLDHNILVLHRDAASRLWVGTASGGLARYDPRRDHFDGVQLGEAVPTEQVRGLEDDRAGGLWVAANTGLFHLNQAGAVLAHLRHDGTAAALPDEDVQKVLLDRAGVLWVGSASGLARGTNGNTRFVPVALPAPAGAAVNISALRQDSGGRVWIGTSHYGAFVVEPGGQVPELIAATDPNRAETTAPIRELVEIAPGRIWLGTGGRGIVEVDERTRATRRIRSRPELPSSLGDDSVYGLYRDRSGIVWVETERGLSQYLPANDVALSLLGATGRTDGLSDSSPWTLAVAADGRIWAGMERNGLNIIDIARGRITALPALAGHPVVGLAPLPDGMIVATEDGLYRADLSGQSLRRLEVPASATAQSLLALNVQGDTVWLGTEGAGMWQLRLNQKRPPTVLQHLQAPLLTSGDVRAILKLPDGRLAVGTESGLNFFDPVTRAVEHVMADPADPESLSARQISSLALDRNGLLWVGTAYNGVNVMLGRDGAGRPRFRHLGVPDGMPNGDIDGIEVDRNGRVWLATDDGLVVVDPKTFALQTLRRADGLAISAYWGNSGTLAPGGEVLFGGIGGLTVVQPDRLAPWQYRPPVVITEILAGGKPRLLDGPKLEVEPDGNSLKVEFAALDFSAPDRNRYAYRLDGFDKDWQQGDAAHRVAAYTNLPPGEYRLQLRGSNRNGAWTDPPTTLAVRVQAAWFQTLWFRLTEFAVVGAVGMGLMQARTLMMRRRQIELERQVSERTAALAASQAQLKQFAYFDILTALPNRRAFSEEFRGLLNDRRSEQSFALVLIDLDGFKQVNDMLGHDAGDALLVLAAGRLREAVRDGDFVARLGGDEFALLLSAVREREAADLVCARIVQGMAEPMTLNGTTVQIGASVGVALYPAHGRTQDELYKHVDLALYDAKRSGRGVWRWFEQRLLRPGALPLDPAKGEALRTH